MLLPTWLWKFWHFTSVVAIISIVNKISQAIDLTNGPHIIIFLDLSQPFDNVGHIILSKIENCELKVILLSLLKDYLRFPLWVAFTITMMQQCVSINQQLVSLDELKRIYRNLQTTLKQQRHQWIHLKHLVLDERSTQPPSTYFVSLKYMMRL